MVPVVTRAHTASQIHREAEGFTGEINYCLSAVRLARLVRRVRA